MDTLVRREVLEGKSGNWLGTIRLAMPLSQRILALASMVIGVALAMFLWFGHYTRREPAKGVLVPSTGLLEVTANSSGVVATVPAVEGSQIRVGQPLITLTTQRSSAAVGNTNQFLAEQFRAQRGHLDADIAVQQMMELEKAADLRRRMDLLRSQLAILDQQLDIQKRQTASAIALLTKISPLQGKGYISIIQVQQQEAAVLGAQSSEKSLERQWLDAQQQLSVARSQLEQLPLTTAAESHELEIRRAEVERALAENDVALASVLHAPKSGVVASIFVNPGQSVTGGQPLLAMIPEGSHLIARLLVSNRTIGLIAPGDTVVLRYQAFPFQNFGLHHGRIKTISLSAMSPAQVASMTGSQSNEALYRVDVDLDTQFIEAYGRSRQLKPGMVVDAEILLDRHRLIEWIFAPLQASGRG